ncbi:D-glycero-D-manno-heptose 1,7-bisphosphate phosphatase [Enhygromyxa salina]|uniref:D,D-heptose 1,7-bisphosphate phosphatase n=1 Tax=Enhygromyxa salina TaxID=215803 RepID=A0A0C2DFV1_9BACT|nr:HAD-IIIA family hydrolase [Enhygromyxa salina]KIG18517.1 D-glycero-D-manno-heptose 1,7-bisphosphate phosphatase [Enhygromyxa salina]
MVNPTQGVIAVIVAGGLATRMASATAAVPKVLLAIAGKSVLEHQLQQFRAAGITRVIVLAGHLAGAIELAAARASDRSFHVEVRTEAQAMGSGGCLRQLHDLNGPAVVVFGDVMFDVDLGALLETHTRQRATITAVVHPNTHPHDSDLVDVDADHRVTALHPKPHPPGSRLRNLVTAGLFVIEPAFIEQIPSVLEAPKLDLVQDLITAALARGQRVQAWQTSAYLHDMGTPQRYAQAQAAWAQGIPARRRRPRATVFVDRDGTLNRHVGYLRRPEQLELLPGVAQAIARLNQLDVQVVVVTNQPVLARGELDEAGLAQIHAELETQLGRAGAYVDRIYHCPHHPDAGFEGERPELKCACACRKPRTGMIDAATSDLHVDRAASVLIGDTERDLDAALNAGLRPVLVSANAHALAVARGVQWFPDLARACLALFPNPQPNPQPNPS